MILEDSLKFEKERDTSGSKAGDKEVKPTTREIFNDSKSEDRFGKMLTRDATDGDEEAEHVAEVLADPKTAAAGDLENVQIYRHKFAERMKACEKIASEISVENIDNYVGAHPELQRVLSAVGKDGAVDMIKKWLPEVAVNDPAQFAGIQADFSSIVTFREDNPAKTAFERLCKDNKLELDMSEFARLMQNPHKKERTRELRVMVREHMSGFQKATSAGSRIWNFGLSSNVTEIARKFESVKKEIEIGKKELVSRKEALGKALGIMFDENPTIREALFLEMQGQKKEPEKIFPLKEARKAIHSEAEAIAAWENEKRSANYHGLNDGVARKYFDAWQDRILEQAQGKERGGGIWGMIVAEILLVLFDRLKKDKKFTL